MPVRSLATEDHQAAVTVLVDAFGTYPTLRWVLAPSPMPHDAALATLLGFFVTARLLRGEPVLGAFTGGRLAGVALVSNPDGQSPEELDHHREALWNGLGDAARERYEAHGAAAAAAGEPVTDPRLYLNLLGAARVARGQGVGGALLEHLLAAPSAQGRTVVAVTEDPANLTFYQRHGFNVVGYQAFGDDLTVWALGRAAGPSDGLA